MAHKHRVAVIVIGGGIVGLSVARELLLRHPDQKVFLLEKEPEIAAHQTSHNSGVIHSGIYYPPHSEKAIRCREGIRLLEEFCDRHGIRRRRLGKVIVATTPEECIELERLYHQGITNQIPGLRMISREELEEREPVIRGLKALHLPEVALVDFREVSRALRKEFEDRGGTVLLHRKVIGIHVGTGEVRVETDRGSYSGSFLVNCGGLYVDRLARLAGCPLPARIVPFRGEYLFLCPEISARIRGLVYPVPDSKLPFLGVHLTPTLNGKVTVGPNAVLALAREGYHWRSIDVSEVMECLFYGGFWRMGLKYWRTGIFEVARSLIRPLYAASVRKFLPDLKSSDLAPGFTGVRAQAVDRKGELVHDFLYVEKSRQIHVLNAPSPAATASLAMAKRIADQVKLD